MPKKKKPEQLRTFTDNDLDPWEFDEALNPDAAQCRMGEVGLWVTVIKLAIMDFTSTSNISCEQAYRLEASYWLLEGGEKYAYDGFLAVCNLVGLSPQRFREILLDCHGNAEKMLALRRRFMEI